MTGVARHPPGTLVPLLVVGVLVLGACGDGASEGAVSGDVPITVDSCGRQVTIEDSPERMLTVASVAAPLVAAAGAADKIIAREPDLVITYEGSDNAPQDLEAAGIDVLVNRAYCLDTATGDFEEIFADIELFGRLLGTEDAAAQEVAERRDRVAAVEEQPPGGSPGRSAAALIFGLTGAKTLPDRDADPRTTSRDESEDH